MRPRILDDLPDFMAGHNFVLKFNAPEGGPCACLRSYALEVGFLGLPIIEFANGFGVFRQVFFHADHAELCLEGCGQLDSRIQRPVRSIRAIICDQNPVEHRVCPLLPFELG